MTVRHMIAALTVMMMGGPPEGGEDQGRLIGDRDEILVTSEDGRIECARHHDDWMDVDWEAPQGADGAVQRSLYRDVTSYVLPEGREWLLMEPAAHEIRRRSRVCLTFSTYLFLYVTKCEIYRIPCM